MSTILYLSKYYLNLFVVILLVLTPCKMSSEAEAETGGGTWTEGSPGLSILTYGGNGFIGSEVLIRLFEQNPRHNITLISRGNWYWDSFQRIRPLIAKHINCDRDGDMDYCPELLDFLKNDQKFDILIDFSGYKPEYLEDTLELMHDKIGLYIYISTDSVYEVCTQFNGPLAKEEFAQRPQDDEEKDRLNDLDNYGDEKLQGEEVLEEWRRDKNGPPYLIFRLPDVIGPRDTTERWWTYQMWVELYDFLKTPIHIPEDVKDLKTSYVYVKDIAQAVNLAVTKWTTITPGDTSLFNTSYNLGLDETKTLKEFLAQMAQTLDVQSVEYNYKGEMNMFPSVTRGGLDISKVKNAFGFQPTPWNTVFNETTTFYKEAFLKFKSERDDIAHQISKLIPRERKGEFLRYIDSLSGDVNKKEEL